MTPFKIKVLVSRYEDMGYVLKSGDTICHKNREGDYVFYCKLTKFDEKLKCWQGKTEAGKVVTVDRLNSHIEIVVIPFEQYLKKMKQSSFQ